MNSQAPKLHRLNTIARAVADYIVDARPDREFRWSELKGVYDGHANGSPRYSGMQLTRLLRKWAIRVGHGRYKARWLNCACAECLIPNSDTEPAAIVLDGVKHTWDNCSGIDSAVELSAVGPDSFGGEDFPVAEDDFEIVEDKEIYLNNLHVLRHRAYDLYDSVAASINEIEDLIERAT